MFIGGPRRFGEGWNCSLFHLSGSGAVFGIEGIFLVPLFVTIIGSVIVLVVHVVVVLFQIGQVGVVLCCGMDSTWKTNAAAGPPAAPPAAITPPHDDCCDFVGHFV